MCKVVGPLKTNRGAINFCWGVGAKDLARAGGLLGGGGVEWPGGSFDQWRTESLHQITREIYPWLSVGPVHHFTNKLSPDPLPPTYHELHETCDSITFYFMKKRRQIML